MNLKEEIQFYSGEREKQQLNEGIRFFKESKKFDRIIKELKAFNGEDFNNLIFLLKEAKAQLKEVEDSYKAKKTKELKEDYKKLLKDIDLIFSKLRWTVKKIDVGNLMKVAGVLSMIVNAVQPLVGGEFNAALFTATGAGPVAAGIASKQMGLQAFQDEARELNKYIEIALEKHNIKKTKKNKNG